MNDPRLDLSFWRPSSATNAAFYRLERWISELGAAAGAEVRSVVDRPGEGYLLCLLADLDAVIASGLEPSRLVVVGARQDSVLELCERLGLAAAIEYGAYHAWRAGTWAPGAGLYGRSDVARLAGFGHDKGPVFESERYCLQYPPGECPEQVVHYLSACARWPPR